VGCYRTVYVGCYRTVYVRCERIVLSFLVCADVRSVGCHADIAITVIVYVCLCVSSLR